LPIYNQHDPQLEFDLVVIDGAALVHTLLTPARCSIFDDFVFLRHLS